MTTAPGAAPRPRLPRLALRLGLPALLLGSEFLILSLLVDLPMEGGAKPLVDALRVAIPVVLGAAAAGWMVARAHGVAGAAPAPAPLPAWHPAAPFLLQLVGFAAALGVSLRVLSPGAPPPAASALLLLLGCAAVAAVGAIAMAAPLGWVVREVVRRWRAPLLALALGVAAWQGAAWAEGLWGLLSAGTLRASAALLGLVAGGVAVDPDRAVIGLGGFAVHVAPVCSGADGLGLVVTFQLMWLALARQRLRLDRALWLVPLGAAAALCANVVRIAGLVLLGAAGHEDLAVGGFHSKAGWALFLAIALGSVALAERVPWWRRPGAARAATEPGAPLPDAATLAPLVAALAVGLLTGVWTAGALDRLYALRIVAALAALAAVRGALPPLRPSRSALPAALGLLVGVAWAAALRGPPQALAGELAALGGVERVAWLAVRTLGSVLVIPLVEELAFRGFLFDWLAGPAGAARRFPLGAVVGSALAFGTLHASFAAGALAGLALGAVRAWRGRVGDAVVAHAVANAVVAAAALWLGRLDLWT